MQAQHATDENQFPPLYSGLPKQEHLAFTTNNTYRIVINAFKINLTTSKLFRMFLSLNFDYGLSSQYSHLKFPVLKTILINPNK